MFIGSFAQTQRRQTNRLARYEVRGCKLWAGAGCTRTVVCGMRMRPLDRYDLRSLLQKLSSLPIRI